MVWLITLVGLVLRAYRYAQAGPRTGVVGYDDGVYFGASVRLVHGSLPYRDFVFVHPPVITELFAPLAAFAGPVSTVHLVEIARVLTSLVGAATVLLLGRLLRHRGLGAVVVGCGVLATNADAVSSSRATLLEPYLALFFVLGLVVLFDGDRFASPRRTFWAGVLLGVAAATKIWAFGPIAVLLVICLRDRTRLTRLGAGVAAGAAVPCLPFLLVAPGTFFDDVVVHQFTRSPTDVPIWYRIDELFGLTGWDPIAHWVPLLVGALLVVAVVAGYGLLWRSSGRAVPLEIAALGMLAVAAVMFGLANSFSWHYAGFFAPLLGLALALPASAVRIRVSSAVPVCVVLAALLYSCVRHNDAVYWTQPDVAAIDRAVPADSCVLLYGPGVGLAVDRFPTDSSCPVVVDPFGTGLVYADGAQGPAARDNPTLVRIWTAALHRSDAVLVSRYAIARLPWPALRPYLDRNFRRVQQTGPGVIVFVRR